MHVSYRQLVKVTNNIVAKTPETLNWLTVSSWFQYEHEYSQFLQKLNFVGFYCHLFLIIKHMNQLSNWISCNKFLLCKDERFLKLLLLCSVNGNYRKKNTNPRFYPAELIYESENQILFCFTKKIKNQRCELNNFQIT